MKIEIDISQIEQLFLDLVITKKCSYCDCNATHKFTETPIAYPAVDKKEWRALFCDKCGHKTVYQQLIIGKACLDIEII